MSATSAEPEEQVGLRERKKARMRESLMESALRLFHENGYQRTTTEEIAACAGVSQRTFFRYFGSKEDVVLEAVEDVDEHLFASLADRPADEPPFTALRNAMVDHWEYLRRGPLHLKGSAMGMVADSPELIEVNMRYCHRRQHRLARAVGERTGVDPATDPRPGVLAAVFLSALATGHQAWCASGSHDKERLLGAFLDRLDLVPEVVDGPWSPPGPSPG
ncbi:AcrR family transcriptional regulator [Nocardiopsis arvandica]|uniref:AcrR family transcriptional regulator n=1 Tax=Nocardiopsis sinuspersici TaxID=501010 RepID=A0A7Z0BIL2_9ACTN|nr:TetR family transcriptional regulator [Nocardiopsis sinuspersici]NYH52186.1 AcrR family transcriptional regulator [Nocardiopsis sinuspersici]